MPPDFLLRCSRCGSEAVWDSDEIPPVGIPEVGEPVLWFCRRCGREMRHTIADFYVMTDKLHREICVFTELDRATVDRVMEEVYRQRSLDTCERLIGRPGPPARVEEVAEASGVSAELVEQIAVAETDWMTRHGYLAGRSEEK